MRLIVHLKAQKDIQQKDFLQKYNNAMNAYIYGILSDKFPRLHDENDYKGFCFGNIHPIRSSQIKQGENKRLVISSVNPAYIETLFFAIKNDSLLNLGEGSFEITDVNLHNVNLGRNDEICTPFWISLMQQVSSRPKPLLFNKDKGSYLQQLSKNLINKFNKFNDQQISDELNLFENVDVKQEGKKDEYSQPLNLNGTNFNVIGNKLSFKFNNISEEQLKVFQCSFDAGFGEKNSYGFGFMIKRFNND
mgnify:CR=1 FL=1